MWFELHMMQSESNPAPRELAVEVAIQRYPENLSLLADDGLAKKYDVWFAGSVLQDICCPV